MIQLAIAIVWAAVAAFATIQLADVVRDALDAWERVATPPVVDRSASAEMEIPNDLEALVMSQSELWAQEDISKAIHERYEEYGGDWNKVRSAFGLGELS